jgi:hypothetical protein
MRRMSFALTTQQIRDRSKTVTRRKGWKFLKPGDRLLPVLKCMGLKKGEKHTPIGDAVLEVVSVRRQRLDRISQEGFDPARGHWIGCAREGFPVLTPIGFCDLYCRANGGDSLQVCTRIEFRYVDLEAQP